MNKPYWVPGVPPGWWDYKKDGFTLAFFRSGIPNVFIWNPKNHAHMQCKMPDGDIEAVKRHCEVLCNLTGAT